MAGYVEKSLAGDEHIVYRAHFNWTYSFFPVLWFAIGCAPVAMYLMIMARGIPFEELRTGWWITGIGFAIGSLILTIHLINLMTTEIVITNYRLVYKTGWIARNTQEVSLANIEEMTLTQSVWGRLLGYGKLVIRGTGVGVIELPNLDDPIVVRKKIEAARATLRGGGRGN
jgi:uncharacterized membrane protein YdbT with pleckstrin-like domain